MPIATDEYSNAHKYTAGQALQEIRQSSKSQKEKGLAFERLVKGLLQTHPEYEFEEIWSWSEWPDREEKLDMDGIDVGIDLVAKRPDGSLCAIQCKCYDPSKKISYPDIQSFMSESSKKCFTSRILVATCPWNNNAEKAIKNQTVPISRIDFDSDLAQTKIEWDETRPKAVFEPREPWELQKEAIQTSIDHFAGDRERGWLEMACGTGKTYVSLKIMESLVDQEEIPNITLFVAPSLALISQAHREWLRFRDRKYPFQTMIVCSDKNTGKGENTDISPLELVCPPTTNAETLAENFQKIPKGTRITIFCTYHSLPVIQEAQKEYGFPGFGITICDEAHRTAGKVLQNENGNLDFQGFQLIHDGAKIQSQKRLYMTATKRTYNSGTATHFRNSLKKNNTGGILLDMTDSQYYGHMIHRLTFQEAVKAGMLVNFQVVVLCMDENDIRLNQTGLLGIDGRTPTEIGRVLGAAMAVTGKGIDQKGQKVQVMNRSVAYANDIARSKSYRDTLKGKEIRREFPEIGEITAAHVDGKNTSLQRNLALRNLRDADTGSHVLCNAKLLTEGIDVPALDAVIFLDPRKCQIDVVQAVGRVMRKSPDTNKKLGYVIIPVVVPLHAENPEAYLDLNHEGFSIVWKVLSAMTSHDQRFLEEIENQDNTRLSIQFVRPKRKNGGFPKESDTGDDQKVQDGISQNVREFTGQVQAMVLRQATKQSWEASTAGRMAFYINQCGNHLIRSGLGEILSEVMQNHEEDADTLERNSKIACLLLLNACLMHVRLEEHMTELNTLSRIATSERVSQGLIQAWETILEKDYRPIYEDAMRILDHLQKKSEETGTEITLEDTLGKLITCARENANPIAKLGFDHAGPLYHRLLENAKSDGAFYTNNISAVLLAGLALPKDFCDWNDLEQISKLWVVDPAMGTGTLLMAAMRQIKTHHSKTKNNPELMQDQILHRILVENVLCGMDINPHGVQLGALNLTLGAPTVDYRQMNLRTMAHGPQKDGDVLAGSLELLDDGNLDLFKHEDRKAGKSRISEVSRQIDGEESESGQFKIGQASLVIMNPPFTDNVKKGSKFSASVKKKMQDHEKKIAGNLTERDKNLGKVIDFNSIGTFFTPIADTLLKQGGTLAKVIPTTACLGESGIEERKFLAENYQIEIILTSHDPKCPNFSVATKIHESLFVARKSPEGTTKPVRFVSIHRMPESAEEAEDLLDAIRSTESATNRPPGSEIPGWGKVTEAPARQIRDGDWSAAQWYDNRLRLVAETIDQREDTIQISKQFSVEPAGRAIRGAFDHSPENSSGTVGKAFWSVSSGLRDTLQAEPEEYISPKPNKENVTSNLLSKAGNILICAKMRTTVNSVVSIHSEKPAVGSAWIPVSIENQNHSMAICAYLNSTAGILSFLNRRAKDLCYPNFAMAWLKAIPIPDFDKLDSLPLYEAFQEVKNTPMLSLSKIPEDSARQILDQAVAKTLGIPYKEIQEWGRLLAVEPTISNRRPSKD